MFNIVLIFYRIFTADSCTVKNNYMYSTCCNQIKFRASTNSFFSDQGFDFIPTITYVHNFGSDLSCLRVLRSTSSSAFLGFPIKWSSTTPLESHIITHRFVSFPNFVLVGIYMVLVHNFFCYKPILHIFKACTNLLSRNRRPDIARLIQHLTWGLHRILRHVTHGMISLMMILDIKNWNTYWNILPRSIETLNYSLN